MEQVKADLDLDKRRLSELSQLDGKEHIKSICSLRSHDTFGRYVIQSKEEMFRLDKNKIASEELLDGKFLVDTSNMSLDVAEVALGYKQLFETQSSRLRYSSQISKEAKDLFGKLSVKTSPKVLGVESIV